MNLLFVLLLDLVKGLPSCQFMSGTVEVDDSSLAPTASSILIRRGMETAFLMVGLQALVRPLLVCLYACVSLRAATCLARLWLFVVGMTSKKTKKVCVRAMCEFQLFAACTCADSASSAAARLPGNLRLSLHGPSLARRSSDETL